MKFLIGLALVFVVATQSASAGPITPYVLLGAPYPTSFYYGMCCNVPDGDVRARLAAGFTLAESAYVSRIDLVLLGSNIFNSSYDFSLQNSLTAPTTNFAGAVLTAPVNGQNALSLTVEAMLPAGAYYLVGVADQASTLLVPGWFVSDGTIVIQAGGVTNGVWFGSANGTWGFVSGVQPNGFTYNAPTFTVYGFQSQTPPSTVPEPASLTLTALGLAGTLARRRRFGARPGESVA